jgi:hypothetical protein
MRNRRPISPLALLALLGIIAVLVAPPTPVQARDAKGAKSAEDALEELLRRFGEDAVKLKGAIEMAINTGTDFLMEQQQDDGKWNNFLTDGSAYGMSQTGPAPEGALLGGTALCALAVKKSIIGLYEGEDRDRKREIRSLERLEKSGKIDYWEKKRLNFLRNQAPLEIARREKVEESVKKALVWLRMNYEKHKDNLRTYDVGVILMLLEAYYTKRLDEDEGYSFGVEARDIPRPDLAWIRELVAWLQKKVEKPEMAGKRWPGLAWRYPYPAGDRSNVDTSNTQYAVLGLKAASRMGVHISNPNIWVEVAKFYLDVQEKDGPKVERVKIAQDRATGEYSFPKREGSENYEYDTARGWSYLPEPAQAHPVTGAMTTAGLAALITAKSELYEAKILPRNKTLEQQIDKSINDGLAWLDHYFTMQMNRSTEPNTNYGWHYYYLYGVERVGILAAVEHFGKNPWYIEGAKLLIQAQLGNHAWNSRTWPGGMEGSGTLTDTAFAILFLKRATVPVDVPLKVNRPAITGKE